MVKCQQTQTELDTNYGMHKVYEFLEERNAIMRKRNNLHESTHYLLQLTYYIIVITYTHPIIEDGIYTQASKF